MLEFGVAIKPPGEEGEHAAIIFGMAAIKGVGENVVQAIVEERTANGPFKSIFDLTERVDPNTLTKEALETLIKVGVLDSFGPNRGQKSEDA